MTELAPLPQVRGYQIERVLGRGGMAVVYLATQTALSRAVALKVLDQDSEAAAVAMVRFEQEAKLIAQLSHPHIVGIYDIGRTDSGALYYAMPYLPEGDLKRRARPLSGPDVVEILRAILSALEHAHLNGVVHRDIKPENILFDAHGHALLADFGVAYSAAGRERVTTVGFTVGSSGYMSPEQARGLNVDGRSDLYSVGVLAFELLTSALPFDGVDSVAIAIAQIEEPIPRLPLALKHWQAFIDRALASQPDARFDTARTMREALPAANAEAKSASSPKRWLAWSAVLLLICLLGAAAAWHWRAKPTDWAPIDAMLARGDLIQPAQPNAFDALLVAKLTDSEPDARTIREVQLLNALADRVEVALNARDWVALNDSLASLNDVAASFGLEHSERLIALQSKLDTMLAAEFSQALTRFDRAPAESALALSALLPKLATETVALRERVLGLPGAAGEFSDTPQMELLLIERPRIARAGFAVSAQPLTAAQVSAELKLRVASSCKSQSGAQTCISLNEARELAAALSKSTGHRYRLPTQAEWGLVQRAPGFQPAALSVWTDTCKMDTVVIDKPNALQRGAGKIRSLFGGRPAQSTTTRRCAGYYAMAFNGPKSRVLSSAARDPTVGVVLLREIAPLLAR